MSNIYLFAHENKTNNAFGVIRDIIMCIITIWISSPYQAFFSNWYIYGGLWISWIILAYLSNIHTFVRIFGSRILVYAFTWHSAIAFLSLFGWADFSIKQFTMPFLLISSIYYIVSGYYKSLCLILCVYFLYLISIIIFTIPILYEIPDVARILANSDKSVTQEFAGPFVANFGTVNSITLVSLCVLSGIKVKLSSKVFRYKLVILIYLCFIALSAYFLYLAEYTISLMLFTIFGSLLIFNNKERKLKPWIVILICCISVLFLGPLFNLLADLFADSVNYSTRFTSLATFFTTGEIEKDRDFGIRIMLYLDSIKTFLHHPFLGVGGYIYGANGLVGGHSEILDNFAYYGIFFGSLFIWYLYKVYHNFDYCFSGRYRYFYYIVFSVYLIDCLVNTCYKDNLLFCVFFICPSFIALLQYHNK